jgi:excisionase family DNA binding protein
VSERLLTARDSLLRALAPELVEALEELVEERVAALTHAQAASGNGSPWLSVAEAANYLRVSERKVQRLIRAGRVRSTTLGRRRLLHRDDLDALVAATGEESAPTDPSRHRDYHGTRREE